MGRAGVVAVVLLPLLGAAPVRAAERTFSVPGKSYALSIDLSGCTIDEDRADQSGAGRYVRAHCAKGLNVSFWIEPAEKPGDSRVCRDTWWSRDSGGVADASMRELGDLAVVDYAIGDEVKQRNVRAYLAYRDTWIDFHLSRIELSGSGVGEFDRLLRTVGIIDPR
jgi:hypothetical protein